jgi:hypothetical protein
MDAGIGLFVAVQRTSRCLARHPSEACMKDILDRF